MVLESILTLRGAEKHQIILFFTAFAAATVGMFLSYHTFPSASSVLAIAFVTVTFMPIMHSLFMREEQDEVSENDVPFAFISTHFDVIKIYSIIFLGLVTAFTIWSAVLPEDTSGCTGSECFLPEKSVVFSQQQKVYNSITGKAIGTEECFSSETKSFDACYALIFTNNMWVLVLAIIFSFIWGAGAIFLLGWNASVIGMFIGLEITAKSLESGILRGISYLPHGIPEIIAYFIAAIVGGIISATISKQKFKPHEIRIVLIDSVLLIALAIITLAIGAFIETASIFDLWEATIVGIAGLALLYMVLYIPSVRYKLNKIRKE